MKLAKSKIAILISADRYYVPRSNSFNLQDRRVTGSERVSRFALCSYEAPVLQATFTRGRMKKATVVSDSLPMSEAWEKVSILLAKYLSNV